MWRSAISTSPAPIRRAHRAVDARATHLIKVACEAALGKRPISKSSAPTTTPDGTCVRDYIHVSDLVAPISRRSLSARRRREPVLNCGYGRGYSVLEVIAAVKRSVQ